MLKFIELKRKTDKDYVLDVDLVEILFYFLQDTVFLLEDNTCFHSDIKPDNILIYQENNRKSEELNLFFKVIDFGGIGREFNDFTQCTERYYNYFGRPQINENNQSQFKNKDERLRGELFTITRALQECMLTEK